MSEMTLVIQDIYLKNITFLWDVSVFFRFFHPEFGAKRVRSDAPGQATALPVIVWVKTAELLIGRAPRDPKVMPKEDCHWDMDRK